MNRVSILSVICVVVLFAACAPKPDPIIKPTVPVVPADQAEAVKSQNAFALDLYRALAAGNSDNLFFSPLSISANLAMVAAGARGQTEAELTRALHFTLPADRIHPAIGNLLYGLRDRGAGRDYDLLVANRVWVRDGLTLVPGYEKLLRDFYGADAGRFGNDADAMRAVNGWTHRQTRGECKNIMTEPVPQSAMVLANAVFFHGNWVWEFEPRDTQAQPFQVAPGRSVETPMMSQLKSFNLFIGPGYSAVAMPYIGDGMVMVIFLPDREDGLTQLQSSLTPQAVEEVIGATAEQVGVKVTIPKFSLECGLSLPGVMRSLGVRELFGSQANLSGMLDQWQGIYLVESLHMARVEVDERGTKAWAATVSAPVAEGFDPEPALFTADHPFLFIIGDTKTGAIIFMGRVTDPTKGH